MIACRWKHTEGQKLEQPFYNSVQVETHSSSKVKQLFTTLLRCSSINTLLLQKPVQVEGLFAGLLPVKMQSVSHLLYTAWRTLENRVECVWKTYVLPVLRRNKTTEIEESSNWWHMAKLWLNSVCSCQTVSSTSPISRLVAKDTDKRLGNVRDIQPDSFKHQLNQQARCHDTDKRLGNVKVIHKKVIVHSVTDYKK